MRSVDEIIDELATICGKDGKEKSPKKSAQLFHELGLIHKIESLQSRAPKKKSIKNLFKKRNKLPTTCKIKLIQTAALFNAAIVREPENVLEIKQDLVQFCAQLVNVATKKETRNLIEYSTAIAKDVAAMRDTVNKKLQMITQIKSEVSEEEFTKRKREKIKEIRDLQNYISRLFKQIMELIAGFCHEIMGNPPCRYALVGLGSLSRKEITPYSDFENIIVLDDNITGLNQIEQEKMKEYFRWFAVMFQVILINLGETILPAVYIPCLNNGDPNRFNFYDSVTPLGISFDGMMPHACKSPLGRQIKTKNKQFTLELIQSASKMANFIGSNEDIKNGYHLADMLMTSCFVAGSSEVYQQFQEFVDYEIKMLDKKTFLSTIENQINENTKDFLILTQLKQLENKAQLNIKRMIYRSSTLFVSAVGKLHGVKESCCFDILDKLIEKSILTESIGQDLKFAIAVACETRLRVYMHKKSQDDVVKQSEIKRTFIDETVGMKSVVEYFLIISSFQKNMFELSAITAPDLNLVPQICYYLQNYQYAINWAEKNLYRGIAETHHCSKFDIAYSYCFVGICKHYKGDYTEAITDFKISLDIQAQISRDLSKDKDISYSYYRIGLCKYELREFTEALVDFQTSLEIEIKITSDILENKKIAERYYWIGNCKYELRSYDEALVDLEKSLNIYKKLDESMKEKWIASCRYWIGLSRYQCGEYKIALKELQVAYDIYQKILADTTKSSRISNCLYWIGLCKYKTLEHNEAIIDFKDSLKILKEMVDNTLINREIAERNYAIAMCQHEEKRYNIALTHFKENLKIQLTITKDQSDNITVADCYYWVGKCNYEISKYNESLNNLNHSLAIYEKCGPASTDWIASCQYWIGLCKYHLTKEEALVNLHIALKTYTRMNINGNFLEKIASCEYWIKKCADFIDTKRYEALIGDTRDLKEGNVCSTGITNPQFPKTRGTNLYDRKLNQCTRNILKDLKELYPNVLEETFQVVHNIVGQIFDAVYKMANRFAKYKKISTVNKAEVRQTLQVVFSSILFNSGTITLLIDQKGK